MTWQTGPLPSKRLEVGNVFDAVQDVGQFVVDATMDFGRRLAAPLASWPYEEMEGGVSGFGRHMASGAAIAAGCC